MTTVIKNVRVFDGKAINKELAHVVIENGYIKSIGAMVSAMCDQEYNAKGLTLLPGFIDTHIHIGLMSDTVLRR